MSSPLALAAVTAVLKNLLDNAAVDDSLTNAVGGVTVTALPPDRVKTGDVEVPQLNLFLYHVAPNPGWRNVGLPSRGGNGARLTNAPLALDLHYLVTAYGKKDFDTEVLLGYALHLLHEHPVLTREDVRRTLNGAPGPVGPDLLPPVLQALSAADLAAQDELVKLSPLPMSTEEMYRLWSAFQAKYRPSAAYRASVVLIEAAAPAHAPLPVLTRAVTANPGLLPPFPTLRALAPPNSQPAVRMGETLDLLGDHLDGDAVLARFTHFPSSRRLDRPALPGADAGRFRVRLPSFADAGPFPPGSPDDPNNWRAGSYRVAAVVRRAGQDERVSNELPLALAPRLGAATVTAAAGRVTLAVPCQPRVATAQRVSLVVGSHEIVADPVPTELTDTPTFTAPAGLLPAGRQWLRLRVDGVESLLIDRSVTPPVFAPTESVIL
jgi:hypothetical protein